MWRMRIAFWIPKGTNTLPEYVILIAFSRQLRLREHASILNLYLPCLSRVLLSTLCTSLTKTYKWEHNGKGLSECDTAVFFPFAVYRYEMLECLEIECQLDSTDDFYCRSYCLLNMFRALCPSSGAREFYTGGCCLWYLVLWFSSCRYGVELRVMCPVCGLQSIPTFSYPLYEFLNRNAEGKNEWSSTSLSPCTFVSCKVPLYLYLYLYL